MFHNLLTAKILFRVINFAAFIGLIAFLFKRNLLPAIKKQIQEKKLLLQNLEQQKQGIKYQHNNIDNALEQQKHLADELIAKINLWRTKVEEKQIHEYEQRKALLLKIQEKTFKQSQEQALFHLNKTLVPKVLSHVEQKLTEKFESNDHGQLYIKDIIGFLQESNA